MATLAPADWFSAISAVSAAVAAIFSAITVLAHRRWAVEQRAAESVKKYLELAIQNPGLSGSKKDDQYDWFVSLMFKTIRDVINAHKSDKSWQTFIENQLIWFQDDLVAWKKYDEKNKTTFLKHFGPDVERVVEEFLAKKNLRGH
jgi:hypothetical protein